MIVLVDQDGVLADFSKHFYTLWGEEYPQAPNVPVEKRKHFWVEKDIPDVHRDQVRALIRRKNFFRNLPPVEHALVGINELVQAGHEVFICTSPVTNHRYCLGEKQEWVEEHLGTWFARRMIITQDKTLVCGDVLIDDKPVIEGLMTPQWVHMVFDASYNQHIQTPFRMTWSNWVNAFESLTVRS
jgi:5'-nucleotidase